MDKHYQAVKVGNLTVDPAMDTGRLYMQREEVTSWTNKITEAWDVEMLLPAIVSKRADGTLVIIDGQHSNQAAIRMEGKDFLRDTMVYEGLTVQQEAKLFLAANKHRKPVKPFDNFRVSLTAGDPVAKRVNDEVQSLGNDLQVAASPSANRVGAVQALLAMGAKREGMVKRILTLAEAAWGRDASTWDNMILRAIGMVLDVPGNWEMADDKRLIKVLAKASPAIWKQNSVRQTKSGGGSSSRSMPMMQQIVSEYNHNLDREKMLLTGRSKATSSKEEMD